MRMSTAGAANPKITSSPGEDISGRRPHVLHEGYGQSVAAVPARERLLAHVGLARVDAEAFDVACRAVRHVAPAPHQTRSPRRRDEDDDQDSSADIMSRSGYFASRARPHPAPRHLRNGAAPPRTSNPSRQPANLFSPALWLTAEDDATRPRATANEKNHANAAATVAEKSMRCIMRAKSVSL